MKLYIRNMVSTSCKMIVKNELEKIGIPYERIYLGEVNIPDAPNKDQYRQLKIVLSAYGLELMVNKKDILVERIKNTVIDMVRYVEEHPKIKNSNYLSEKIALDYTYMANIFSKETGTTIEHYIIYQKIERAKELILYRELNLTEISYLLNYSSVAHLSRQFKQITGSTASFFKQTSCESRIALENVLSMLQKNH
ncbi:helix-turn-helix domain-containing protein [Pedobacter sp. SL55]|uniref:helix-turn-helix domain-containing protein n=1 Tax=Pedobacter sp. SL55 TaxID=2995161 RepID=UPI0022721304|nr:AraC family transcriptional regulator [Pedobacter sp. SL55]WAC39393.1 AraC family transcriptional regulator [Pedobacter sp. SL55]